MISIIPRRTRKRNVVGKDGRSKIRGWEVNRDSVEIERAWCARSGTFHDVEVDHRGFDAGVSQEGLDGTDIGAGLE